MSYQDTVRFIQDQFRNDGFVQVDRNKDIAVYLKTKMDKFVERYQSSEEWGTYGFTYATLKEAEAKLINLQKGKRCQTR